MFATRATCPRATFIRVPSRSYAVGDNLLKSKAAECVLRDTSGQTIPVSQIFEGKKVVLVGVPGAFTPVCSTKHVPTFIEASDQLGQKGVDTVAVVSVNDHFVMKAWGEKLNAGDKVKFFADPDGSFTKAIHMDMNLGAAGLGLRSKRYAMIINNGVILKENVEKSPGEFTVTGAQDILKILDQK